jgi:hypothetical protein
MPNKRPQIQASASADSSERVQTGVRIEKRLLKVLKALAALYDTSLGDLLERIVMSSFEGNSPFDEASLERIRELNRIYGVEGPSGGGAELQGNGSA